MYVSPGTSVNGAPQVGHLSFAIFFSNATFGTPACISIVQFFKYPLRIAPSINDKFLGLYFSGQ